MYRVLHKFRDLQDKNYIYNEGDIYPRKGLRPGAERIEELESGKNRRNISLIEYIPEDIEDEEAAEVSESTEIKPKTTKRKGCVKNAESNTDGDMQGD